MFFRFETIKLNIIPNVVRVLIIMYCFKLFYGVENDTDNKI